MMSVGAPIHHTRVRYPVRVFIFLNTSKRQSRNNSNGRRRLRHRHGPRSAKSHMVARAGRDASPYLHNGKARVVHPRALGVMQHGQARLNPRRNRSVQSTKAARLVGSEVSTRRSGQFHVRPAAVAGPRARGAPSKATVL